MAFTKVFSLEGKALKLDNAEDIASHIQPLKDDSEVEEARFLGNTLGIGACEALAAVLATKKTLQSVNLADIFTGRLLSEIPTAIDAVLKALLELPNLHTVNLNDNAFGLNTVEPLLSFLSQHTPLEHLYLNNNGMGPIAGEKIGEALATLAEKKKVAGAKPLRTIVCGRNRLENGSMPGWVKAFAANTGVTHIRMVQNGIRQEGITLLLREGLSHVPGLQLLELEDNTFTTTGAKALADNVGRWSDLQELGLNDCYLSARGAVFLGEALKAAEGKKLQTLKLQFNNIDGKGVKTLADIVEFLPALQRVELNGNKFSEDDNNIDRLREVLDGRREEAGAEEDDEAWGVDELDELESEDEDEDEEEQEAEEEEKERATEVKRADEAKQENVPLEKDKKVDELADLLGKTGI